MTTFTIGRWLLVALAVVGLALAVPVVSAHGDAATDAPTDDGNETAADWAAWMEDHMTDYMGPDAVEWMESHTGLTVDEMARDMADGDHHNIADEHNDVADDHDRGMAGQGHC